MQVFKVISWNTNKIITETTTLASAKKHCRDMGHTDWHDGTWYLPVAWVSNEQGECVYNPRFRVR